MKVKIKLEMSADELKEYMNVAFTEGFYVRGEAEEKLAGANIPTHISLEAGKKLYTNSMLKRLVISKLEE